EPARLDDESLATLKSGGNAIGLERAEDGVRVLADGEIKDKITIVVAGASKPAVEKIEKAGGNVTLLSAPAAAE
ncbi:uL15 family ribosomal protein, partial [Rhizobium ruizarguesonis]